jgi:hypothetical protein
MRKLWTIAGFVLHFVLGIMFAIPWLFSTDEIVANVIAFFGGAR